MPKSGPCDPTPRQLGAPDLAAIGLLAVGLAVVGANPEQARPCLRQSRELSTALAYNSLIDHGIGQANELQ
jgi:hypothetical protein